MIETVPTQLLIGGEWVDATGGATFEVDNPADAGVLTRIADATPDDGERALAAAAEAQQEWRATEPRKRGEILRSAFELLTERADDFARLMTLEMGKTLAEARGEVAYGAEFFRWFSEEAVRIHGRYSPAPAGNTRLITMKGPVGPTLMITPWNFPLAMGTRKIGPAIAAGCTMVVKPAHETPLTMLALAALLEEVGLPAGVLNVVTTTDSGGVCEPIIRDPRAAQADLHRLDRRGQEAGRAGLRPAAAGVHGARRQRPLHRLRRRRPRRRGRRRDARQDAQHRRGLHLGQPLPRPRVGRRGVLRAGSPSGWAR